MRALLVMVVATACGTQGGRAGRVPVDEPVQAHALPPTSSGTAVSSARHEPFDPEEPIPTRIGDLTFGLSPDQVQAMCAESNGRAVRMITSNRILVLCELSEGSSQRLMTLFCDNGDGAKACLFEQQAAELSESAAANLWRRLDIRLTEGYGPASKADTTSKRWTSSSGLVQVVLGQDEDAYSVSLVHATSGGLTVLSNPGPAFPSQVAGLHFDATLSDTARLCAASGGVYVDPETMERSNGPSIAPTFACAGGEIDVPFKVEVVSGHICGGGLCEIQLLVAEEPRWLLDRLRGKYGAPSVSGRSQCKPDGKTYTWLWGISGNVEGVLRMVDDCRLMVVYDNAAGWRLREKEYTERRENY